MYNHGKDNMEECLRPTGDFEVSLLNFNVSFFFSQSKIPRNPWIRQISKMDGSKTTRVSLRKVWLQVFPRVVYPVGTTTVKVKRVDERRTDKVPPPTVYLPVCRPTSYKTLYRKSKPEFVSEERNLFYGWEFVSRWPLRICETEKKTLS